MITITKRSYVKEQEAAKEAAEAAKKAKLKEEQETKKLESMESEVSKIRGAINSGKRAITRMTEHAMTDEDYSEMSKWNGRPNKDTAFAYNTPFVCLDVLSLPAHHAKADRKRLIEEWRDWLESEIPKLPEYENPYSPRKATLKQLAKARALAATIEDGGITLADQREAVSNAHAEAVRAEERRKEAEKELNAARSAPEKDPFESARKYAAKLQEEEKKLGI